MVEEGEIRYKDYIYSNRLAPTKDILDEVGLSKKYSKYSYAKLAKILSKESEERPNDPISQDGLNSVMSRLKDAQEITKSRIDEEEGKQSNDSQQEQPQEITQPDTTQIMQQPSDEQQYADGGDVNILKDGSNDVNISARQRNRGVKKMSWLNNTLNGLLPSDNYASPETIIQNSYDNNASKVFRFINHNLFSIPTAFAGLGHGTSNEQNVNYWRDWYDQNYRANYEALAHNTISLNDFKYNIESLNKTYQYKTGYTNHIGSVDTSIPIGTIQTGLTGLGQGFHAIGRGLVDTFRSKADKNAERNKILKNGLPYYKQIVANQKQAANEIHNGLVQMPTARQDATPQDTNPVNGQHTPINNGGGNAYYGGSGSYKVKSSVSVKGKVNNNSGPELDTSVNKDKSSAATPTFQDDVNKAKQSLNQSESSKLAPVNQDFIDSLTKSPRNKFDRSVLRTAPIWASAANFLTDMLGLTNKPDYENENFLAMQANSLPEIHYKPSGNYFKTNPISPDYVVNKTLATAMAGQNQINNTANGNASAAQAFSSNLLNNAFNAMGDDILKVEAQNIADQNNITEKNNSVDFNNADRDLQAQMANQSRNELNVKVGEDIMASKNAKDAAANQAKSLNLTNFANNLGEYGREGYQENQLNWMKKYGLFGNQPIEDLFSDYNNGKMSGVELYNTLISRGMKPEEAQYTMQHNGDTSIYRNRVREEEEEDKKKKALYEQQERDSQAFRAFAATPEGREALSKTEYAHYFEDNNSSSYGNGGFIQVRSKRKRYTK